MSQASMVALLGYMGWMMVLLLILAGMRVYLTVSGQRRANSFSTTGEDVSPFNHRLCRSHANCYEHFPILCGPLLLALAVDATAVTNGLALWMLAGRIGQSLVHLWSTRNLAVQLRFVFFLAQYLIAGWWLLGLARWLLR